MKQTFKARWAPNKIPGRTPEERAAAATAAIIAPNTEAMRKELAKRKI
jgi:hypothetical protein